MAKLELDFKTPYGTSGLFYPGNPEFPVKPPVNPPPYTGDDFSIGPYVFIMGIAIILVIFIQLKLLRK